MARPLRIQFAGAFYHVMNRGLSRAPIFYEADGDRALFKQTLAEAVRLWKIRVHAYSLMDNHYHLLIETPLPNLSRAMQHIDGIYTQRFNRKHKRDGPLIRGRYKSILVEQETYFLELIRYIHLNGVRALRFPSARTDHNCSHPDYLHPQRSAPWLEKNLALSHFSDDLHAFDRFIHEGVSAELETKLSHRRWPAVLGTKEFIETIRARFLRGRRSSPEIPQVADLHRLNLKEPHSLIEQCLDFEEQERREKGPNSGVSGKELRWALVATLRRHAHLSFSEIGLLFDGLSTDATEKILKRNNYSESVFFKKLERALNGKGKVSDVGI